MGLVNLVISSIGKCIDLISFLLDLNFAIVHTLIRSVIGLITFVNNLPMLTVHCLFDLWNLFLFGLMLLGAAASNLAHGALAVLGSCTLALGGLVETLKMAGYLSAHLFLRGKEHLCRALLSVLEGCDIAVSLAVYFVNTVINFVLIAAQNLCSALTSVWQAVSSPLQKVLELTLTLLTFLYSSLVGTTNILCAPCILLLDFLASLTQIFVSVFILNVYGFLLTVAIAAAATAYLNPATSRQVAQRVVDYVNSVPGLRRASVTLRRDLRDALRRLPVVARQLQRLLRRLYLLERGLWRRLSHQSSRLGLTMRTWLHGQREEEEDEGDDRVGGDGDPGGEGPRRDPPDGRAGDGGGRRELLDRVLPSSSTDRPLKKLPSGKDGGAGSSVLPTADSLLSLLKEQEERKKCVICQDCTKTVVLLPCRHLCLCRDCTNIVLRQPLYQQNCPLCRHMILNTMDVYL